MIKNQDCVASLTVWLLAFLGGKRRGWQHPRLGKGARQVGLAEREALSHEHPFWRTQ